MTSGFVPGSSLCSVRQQIHIASVYECLFLFPKTAQCLSSVVPVMRQSMEFSSFSTCGLRILRSILDSQDMFCGPLYLTVTCRVFGVRH